MKKECKKTQKYDKSCVCKDCSVDGEKPVTPKEVSKAWRDANRDAKRDAEKIPSIANADGVLPVTAFGFNRICNTFGA